MSFTWDSTQPPMWWDTTLPVDAPRWPTRAVVLGTATIPDKRRWTPYPLMAQMLRRMPEDGS